MLGPLLGFNYPSGGRRLPGGHGGLQQGVGRVELAVWDHHEPGPCRSGAGRVDGRALVPAIRLVVAAIGQGDCGASHPVQQDVHLTRDRPEAHSVLTCVTVG